MKDKSNILDRTKSIPNSSAQNISLCGRSKMKLSPSDELLQAIYSMSGDDDIYSKIALIMFNGLLRVSEVLSIKGSDITSSGHVMIYGSKKSEKRVITCSEISNWLKSQRTTPGPIFWYLNRFCIYRKFKQYGISFQSINSSKHSVTHAIRHIVSSSFQESEQEFDYKVLALGHKNRNNSKLYGHDAK